MAEITVETMPLKQGSVLMAIGETTGVVEFPADDIRVNFETVEEAPKGSRCSVKVVPLHEDSGKPFEKLHRGDKIFLWE